MNKTDKLITTKKALAILAVSAVTMATLFATVAASQQDAPAPAGVIQEGVPSVNLTSNDPGYMKAAPGAGLSIELPLLPSVTVSASITLPPLLPTTTSSTTTVAPSTTSTPDPTLVPVTTAPTTTGTTTPPATATSPTANPNITPMVIAWDGKKCAQADSWWVQVPGQSDKLMCPSSIEP